MPALRPLLVSTLLLAALTGCGGKKSGEPPPATTPETGAAPSPASTAVVPSTIAPAAPAPTAGAAGSVAGYIAGLDAIAIALESVKDEASAKAAAVTITEVSARMKDLAAEVDKMPKVERGMAFAGAMQEMSQLQMRIAAAMQPLVAKPELLKQVGDAMKSVPKVK